jgi:hypothetical protein
MLKKATSGVLDTRETYLVKRVSGFRWRVSRFRLNVSCFPSLRPEIWDLKRET